MDYDDGVCTKSLYGTREITIKLEIIQNWPNKEEFDGTNLFIFVFNKFQKYSLEIFLLL